MGLITKNLRRQALFGSLRQTLQTVGSFFKETIRRAADKTADIGLTEASSASAAYTLLPQTSGVDDPIVDEIPSREQAYQTVERAERKRKEPPKPATQGQ